MRRIHIGTSGWHYDHWKGSFYPAQLRASERLPFYAERFHAVEINSSFYRLPDVATIETWRAAVPAGFLFAVKASRYLTHMKKLKDPAAPLGRFCECIALLGDRLGPVLFQLPPHWRCNLARLQSFLAVLPTGGRYAFEFRDPSWFNADVNRLLQAHGSAFCIYDLAGQQAPTSVTADFIYVRLHGPGAAYQGSYTPQALAAWAETLAGWARQGKEVFCFFDNDQCGYAPANAMYLADLVGSATGG